MLCQYYQAIVNVPYTWFVTGILRSEENFVFDRAVQDDTKTLEFFVPDQYEDKFLSIMQYFQSNGYVLSFSKLENRFKQSCTPSQY